MDDGTDKTTCPRCKVPLGHVALEAADLGCPRCGGCFLGPPAAGRLLGRWGLTATEVNEIARSFGGRSVDCAGCGTRMQVVQLRGRPVDVCLGCGAMWLDAHELGALTAGAEDNPGPRPAARTVGRPVCASRPGPPSGEPIVIETYRGGGCLRAAAASAALAVGVGLFLAGRAMGSLELLACGLVGVGLAARTVWARRITVFPGLDKITRHVGPLVPFIKTSVFADEVPVEVVLAESVRSYRASRVTVFQAYLVSSGGQGLLLCERRTEAEAMEVALQVAGALDLQPPVPAGLQAASAGHGAPRVRARPER